MKAEGYSNRKSMATYIKKSHGHFHKCQSLFILFRCFLFRAQTFPFAAYIYLCPKLLTVNGETIFSKLSSTEVFFVSVRDTAKVALRRISSTYFHYSPIFFFFFEKFISNLKWEKKRRIQNDSKQRLNSITSSIWL